MKNLLSFCLIRRKPVLGDRFFESLFFGTFTHPFSTLVNVFIEQRFISIQSFEVRKGSKMEIYDLD